MNEHINMPNAAFELTSGHLGCRFSENKCASSECAIKIGPPGQINGPIFVDCFSVNKKYGHVGPPFVEISNCKAYSSFNHKATGCSSPPRYSGYLNKVNSLLEKNV